MRNLSEELDAVNKQIDELEEKRRAIYKASLNAPKNEKVCSDFIASEFAQEPLPGMEFPIKVSGIHWTDDKVLIRDCHLVNVKPANEEGTYLGIHVGELPLGISVTHHTDSGILTIKPSHHNPTIVVPKLNRVIMGYESWWRRIKTEEDLCDITEEDIEGTWYVKILKGLL